MRISARARSSVWIIAPFLTAGTCSAIERRTLDVRETAGIRRFGYPVGAVLELREPVPAATRFRLLHDGRPVEAQFRPLERAGDLIASVAVDFEGNFLPHEVRRYALELGGDVTPGPEPASGLKIERSNEGFRISNGAHIEYFVPRDLRVLLRSVRTPALEWISGGGRGLVIVAKNGERIPWIGDAAASPIRASVTKEGPIDCVLVFERGDFGAALPGVSAKVELEIPRSKSWVRIDWTIEDPHGAVAGLEAELGLALGAGPTLVDFGAGSFVYAALGKDQVAVLEGGTTPGTNMGAGAPAWKILRGTPDKLEPYVLGPTSSSGPPPEGWAQVMDAKRCTAVAVAGFAHGSADRIEAHATGRLAVSRGFTRPGKDPPAGRKRLRFWLHFVSIPPHVGAVTSPQSMQAPLGVTWNP